MQQPIIETNIVERGITKKSNEQVARVIKEVCESVCSRSRQGVIRAQMGFRVQREEVRVRRFQISH